MATTCLDTITHAMRSIGVLAIGRELKAAEAVEGLFRLQAIIDGLFGNGVGLKLTDTDVTGDVDVATDSRNLVAATNAITLTFPQSPANGARVQIKDMAGNFATYPVTIDGNGRHVEGSATATISMNGTDTTWVYIADDANWAKVAPLALTDTMPIADDEFFTLNLAKRMAPTYGAQFVDDVGLLRAANRIRARFSSSVVIPCDDAVRYLSTQSYRNGLLDR